MKTQVYISNYKYLQSEMRDMARSGYQPAEHYLMELQKLCDEYGPEDGHLIQKCEGSGIDLTFRFEHTDSLGHYFHYDGVVS